MIVNLTQHAATAEQHAAGVVDLPTEQRAALVRALTFDECPQAQDILDCAGYIAELACHNGLGGDFGDDPRPAAAMIGGAPWLMAPLAAELRQRGIEPVFAFSQRKSVEETLPDGSVRKTQVFRHTGWVSAVI